MRRILIIGSLVFALLVIALIAGYLFYFPQWAHQRTLISMQAMGFDTSFFPEPAQKPGALLYKDIALDEEKIGTIHLLKVEYTPFSLLALKRLSTIEIYDLNLFGELNGKTAQDISVSGWKAPTAERFFAGLPSNRLQIKNAGLSLLTKDYGGLTLNFDWQARRRGRTAEFQAALKSSQRQLSFVATASGVAARDYWYTDIDIEDGKIEIPEMDIKSTRMNGWMNIAASASEPLKITSELRAGGVSIMGLPWQNASASIEAREDGYKIFAEGKSIGKNANMIELSLNITKNAAQPFYVSGALHAAILSDLLDYFEGHNKMPFPRKHLALFEKARDMDIEFDAAPDKETPQNILKYRISNSLQNIEIKGNILFNGMSDFRGDITSPLIFLKEAQNAYGAIPGPANALFRGGRITLAGTFENTPENGASLSLQAGIQDAAFGYLTDLSGIMEFNSKTGSLLSGDPLTCHLNLRQDIQQECNAIAEISTKGLHIKSVEAKVFGGTVKLDNYKPGPAQQEFAVHFDNIDLAPLLKTMNIPQLSGSGRIAGALPVTVKNGKAFLKGGMLSNKGSTKVSYKAKDLPAYFNEDLFERENMRVALEDLTVDYFDIHMDGPLTGAIQTKVFAAGKNPGVLNGRTVAFDFKTDIPATFFLNALQPP